MIPFCAHEIDFLETNRLLWYGMQNWPQIDILSSKDADFSNWEWPLSRFLTLPLLMASVFQRFTLLLSNLSLALVNRVLRNFKDAVVIYQTVRLFVLHDNFQMFSVNEFQDVINFVYEAVLKRLIYCTLRQLYSTWCVWSWTLENQITKL